MVKALQKVLLSYCTDAKYLSLSLFFHNPDAPFFWNVKIKKQAIVASIREFRYVSTTAALRHPRHLPCPPS